MEWRLFDEGVIPEFTQPEWYAERQSAPHLEEEGHRDRLLVSAELVREAIMCGARKIIDLGAGDGGLLSLVSAYPLDAVYGYDLQQTNVEAAIDRGVQVGLRDVAADSDWTHDVTFDTCLVATEILEHLVDPHRFIAQLYATPARWLIVSSPYLETPEHHYEYHTWAWDQAGYRKLLEDAGWHVTREATAWISQVILAEK